MKTFLVNLLVRIKNIDNKTRVIYRETFVHETKNLLTNLRKRPERETGINNFDTRSAIGNPSKDA